MSRKQKKAAGATPAKLALIGVLALTLVGVLASNWKGHAAPAAQSADAAVESGGEEPAGEVDLPDGKAESPFGEFAVDRPWPTIATEEMTRFDPLATAAWANALPAAEEIANEEHSAEQLAELRSANNAIIITSGAKRIARIGKHEFQVGDTVGGFRITDISSAGVVLSELD